MDPEKLSGIADWPIPENVKQVRQFTGFCNFYRRYIPNFATLCRPIDQLKRKAQPFIWGIKQQTAFDTLKKIFMTKPFLRQPDYNKKFIIETDASAVATGAVLLQEDSNNNGQLQPIAYISKALTDTERNYQIYDREMLAIIRALQSFRPYILGCPITTTIHCDHKNLSFYREPQHLTGRQARWIEYIQQYNIEIHWKPGKHMIISDSLSRRPDHFKKKGDNEGTTLPSKFWVKENQLEEKEINFILAKLELYDSAIIDIDELHNLIRDNTPSVPNALQQLKLQLPRIKPIRTEFTNEQGLLHFRRKIWVPDVHKIKQLIVRLHHDLPTRNHPGLVNTIEQIRRTYFWPKMQNFVSKYVMGCHVCQQMKIDRQNHDMPLKPISNLNPTLPFSTINVDFITDLPESNGYDSMCVIVDHDCTKMLICLPCHKTISALDTAQLLFDHVYKRFGLPKRIISDRGPQFASNVFRQLCTILNIKQAMSTAYHPQTDGQAERSNQGIEAYMRIFTTTHPEKWTEHIPLIEFTHNNHKNATTQQTPFKLLMGYDPRTFPTEGAHYLSNVPSLQERLVGLHKLRMEALESMQLAQDKLAEKYQIRETTFIPGQMVWIDARNLRRTGLPRKLQPRKEGPFKVLRRVGTHAYQLALPRQWKIHPVFHASLLTRTIETEEYGEPYERPPPDIVEGEEEQEVETIVAHRGQGNRIQYLIKWKGFPTSENTWLHKNGLTHAKEAVKEYHERIRRTGRNRA